MTDLAQHIDPVYSRKETAAFLRLSVRQLDRLQDLRSIRITERRRVYRRSAIQEWLDAREQK